MAKVRQIKGEMFIVLNDETLRGAIQSWLNENMLHPYTLSSVDVTNYRRTSSGHRFTLSHPTAQLAKEPV